MTQRKTPAKKAVKTVTPKTDAATRLAISYAALAKFASTEPERVQYPIQRPVLMPGVIPASAKQDKNYVAMDAAAGPVYEYANTAFCGMGFPGYPYLSELTQRSEYRSPVETTATEMTRKWIKLVSKGSGDQSAKIETLEAELKRHKVRDLFRVAAEQDGFFGRAQIAIKIKGQEDDDSLKLPLVIDPRTIKKGSLLGFKNIEALWTAPYAYNSIDPAADDFYKPSSWFVLGKLVHASRLLTFVGREVPDMLKPAYNFGGMSMSQLMEPYVSAWLRTRQSVSDLLHAFSITILATEMGDSLSGGSGDLLFKRAQLFNQIRDNRGVAVVNKETEEIVQINTPLSGLSELQAQSQEHMAAPAHTPLVKLLGVTPTGLNASSDGEIAVYYDYIAAQQENLFTDNLQKILNIIQLDVFGKIDDAISFEFEPLKELDGEALSRITKSAADAGVAYINAGVISPEEERTRLATQADSGYTSLDPADVPELPDPDVKPDDGMSDETDSSDQKAN